jgi:hypothetical protein
MCEYEGRRLQLGQVFQHIAFGRFVLCAFEFAAAGALVGVHVVRRRMTGPAGSGGFVLERRPPDALGVEISIVDAETRALLRGTLAVLRSSSNLPP